MDNNNKLSIGSFSSKQLSSKLKRGFRKKQRSNNLSNYHIKHHINNLQK